MQIHRAVRSEELDRLVHAGLGRITVPLPWGWCERKKGQWDFAGVDHFLAPVRSSGLPLQGVLGPGISEFIPSWLLSEGGAEAADYIDLFAASCARLAEHCDDFVTFRVEQDLNAAFWWDGLRTRKRRGAVWRDASFRMDLLGASLAAVRRVRPDAELRTTLRPGVPGWKRSLERLVRSQPELDGLGLSLPASGLFADPMLGSDVGAWVREAKTIAARAGRSDLPVEVARCAYPTHAARFTPRAQREWLVAAAHSALEAGASGFHWWALRDQAHDDPMLGYWTPTAERHMGLSYYDSTPKPVMDEFRVLATGDRFGSAESTG